jgi:hypothetical protein
MAHQAFQRIKLLVRAALKRHIPKGVWMAFESLLVGNFLVSSHLPMDKQIWLGICVVIILVAIAFWGGAAFISNHNHSTISEPTTLEPTSTASDTTSEIAQLQQEVATLQKQTSTVIVKNVPTQTSQNNDTTITATDLNPYLTGVIRIVCTNSDDEEDGSGSLWNLPNLGYTVLTNEHVIDDESGGGVNEGVDGGRDSAGNALPKIPNACAVNFGQSSGIVFYYIGLNSKYQWNQEADAADLAIYRNPGWYNIVLRSSSTAPKLLLEDKPASNLNYSISKLRLCPTNISVDSPVSIIGFPAFGYTTDQYGETPHQIITTGIISSAFTHDLTTAALLAYPDFFTSAKMDSGDSGGIAFSKDSNGLCVLGIPTWINSGNYETEGIIQNIRNIFLKN